MEFVPQIDIVRMFPLASFAILFRLWAASKTLLKPAPLLKSSSKVLNGDLANTEQLPISCPLLSCFYFKNIWSPVEFPNESDTAFCGVFKITSGEDLNKLSIFITECTLYLLRSCTPENKKHSSGLNFTKRQQLMQSQSYFKKL